MASPVAPSGGFYHYGTLFSGPYFFPYLYNVIMLDIVPVIVSAALAFFLVYGLLRIQKLWLRYLLLSVIAIPAFIPFQVLNFFIESMGMADGFSAPVLVGLIYALKNLFFPTLVGVIACERCGLSIKKAAYSVAICAALQLVLCLVSNGLVQNSIAKPENYYVMSDWSFYMFRIGFLQGDYALASAVNVVINIIQAIFAVVAFFVIDKFFNKGLLKAAREPVVSYPQNETLFTPVGISAILVAVLVTFAFLILILFNIAPPDTQTLIKSAEMMHALGNSFVAVILAGLFFWPITLCLAYTLHISNRWMQLVMLLCMAFSFNMMGGYLALKNFNLLDNIIAQPLVSAFSLLDAFVLFFWLKLQTKDAGAELGFVSYTKQAALPLTILTVVHMLFVYCQNWSFVILRSREKTGILNYIVKLFLAVESPANIDMFSLYLFIFIPALLLLICGVLCWLYAYMQSHKAKPQPQQIR